MDTQSLRHNFPDAVATMLAPLPGCALRRVGNPVVSLRSTTGYRLLSLRDEKRRAKPIRRVDASGILVWSIRRFDAGGIRACSRWLSEERATPPENRPQSTRTPAGVPANPRHALDPHLPSLSYYLHDQKPRTCHCPGMAHSAIRIPRGCGSRHEWNTTGRWRSSRSCPSSDRSQTHPLPFGFHARVEEILFGLGSGNNQGTRIPMAGGICRVVRERFHAPNDPEIHRWSGRASSCENFPGGTHRIPQEIRGFLRRTLPRLIPHHRRHLLAPLPGCVIRAAGNPVVSLRSTTGYRLISLRDMLMSFASP